MPTLRLNSMKETATSLCGKVACRAIVRPLYEILGAYGMVCKFWMQSTSEVIVVGGQFVVSLGTSCCSSARGVTSDSIRTFSFRDVDLQA
jgi:hypothetical protein